MLLYLFPALTLRDGTHANRSSGPDGRTASAQANHNRRLSKAAKGEWEELIREYVADLIEADPRVKPPDQTNPSSQVAEDLQPVDQNTLERAARRAREGAVTAAATTLTGGPRVQPSREAAAQITAQFITTPTRPDDADSTQRVMRRIRTRTSPKLIIGKSLVLEFVARLRPLAGTGPSGWRNSYIAAIANHRDAKLTGIEAITRWTNAWANGRASRWATYLWTRSLARPFYKENRRAIRPIICAEHLYKLAGGLIFRGARQELIRACGTRQYGYSRPGGAPREAAEIQAAINCNPGWPILTVDVKNAFGSIAWTDAAEIMQQKAPSTAQFLATQWQNGQTTLLIEDRPGIWARRNVSGSLLQGGHDGRPTFCITLWHHIERCMGHLLDDPSLRIWLYVDDVVIQAAPAAWPDVWAGLTAALSEAKFELCAAKSAWYCPLPCPTEQHTYREIFTAAGIQEQQHGISILGTEAVLVETETFLAHNTDQTATADNETAIERAIAGPMHRRLQRALRLNRRVTQLAAATTQAGSAQPAWAITRLVTAHSLDYDFRVLPLGITKPAAEILRAALLTCMTAVTGTPTLTAEQETQVFLPTQHAGLQLQCPVTTAPLARAAHLIENGHHIRDTITRWADQGLTTATSTSHDGIEGRDFGTLARELDRIKQAFDPTGLPAPWTRPLEPHDIRIPAPNTHILSAANRAVNARRYTDLLDSPHGATPGNYDEPEAEESDGEQGEDRHCQRRPSQRTDGDQANRANGTERQPPNGLYNVSGRQCERSLRQHDEDAAMLEHYPSTQQARPRGATPDSEQQTPTEPWRRRCVRLRSAAGPTAGRLWTAQAGAPGTNLTDVEWRTATRYRLGIPLGPGRYQCQNRASDPEALRPTCGNRLGGYGCHALCCSYGPLRNTHHNELADLVARMSQEAGATVTRETPIREFQTDRPAILDVTAFGTAEIVDLIVDVTVRHPTCKKYGRTDLETERAAQIAEVEKQQRYRPAGGRKVTTFAIESWGRLGPEAEQTLQMLSAAARRRDQQRDKLALNRIPKWRALIDATNQRSIARRLLGAFLGTDGKPWRPPPHRRDPHHEANTNRLGPGQLLTYPYHNGQSDIDNRWNDAPIYRATQAFMTPTQPVPMNEMRDGSADAQENALGSHVAGNPITQQRIDQQQHDRQQPTPQMHPPPAGSQPTTRVPAIGGAVKQPNTGRPAESAEWHNCVICLSSAAADGLNVLAYKMPDHTAYRPTQHPIQDQATNTRHSCHHDHQNDHQDGQRPDTHNGITGEITDGEGDISACTGSRSRSGHRSSSSPTSSNSESTPRESSFAYGSRQGSPHEKAESRNRNGRRRTKAQARPWDRHERRRNPLDISERERERQRKESRSRSEQESESNSARSPDRRGRRKYEQYQRTGEGTKQQDRRHPRNQDRRLQRRSRKAPELESARPPDRRGRWKDEQHQKERDKQPQLPAHLRGTLSPQPGSSARREAFASSTLRAAQLTAPPRGPRERCTGPSTSMLARR